MGHREPWWFLVVPPLFGGPRGGKQVEDDQVTISASPPTSPDVERNEEKQRGQASISTKG